MAEDAAHGPRANTWDVLKAMGADNSPALKLAPLGNIIRARRCRAGTQVTIAVAGDIVAGLAGGYYAGGFLLIDRAAFEHYAVAPRDAGASAALIAAAPDLLEALRHAVEWLEAEGCDCGTDEPGTCALCEAAAAIAKAEGRP